MGLGVGEAGDRTSLLKGLLPSGWSQMCVTCLVGGMVGLDLAFCLQGSLVDGRIIDTSLTRDPLVIELGQKQVIPGMWPAPLSSSEPKPLLSI